MYFASDCLGPEPEGEERTLGEEHGAKLKCKLSFNPCVNTASAINEERANQTIQMVFNYYAEDFSRLLIKLIEQLVFFSPLYFQTKWKQQESSD